MHFKKLDNYVKGNDFKDICWELKSKYCKLINLNLCIVNINIADGIYIGNALSHHCQIELINLRNKDIRYNGMVGLCKVFKNSKISICSLRINEIITKWVV